MINFRLQLIFLIIATMLLNFSTSVLAQQAMNYQYIYDDNGQLIRAIDSDGNVVTYQYDPAGNILAVIRSNTADLGPPTIAELTPTVIHQGEIVELIITGSNLLLGEVLINNPGIKISASTGGDNEIRATLNIAFDTALGNTTLSITTELGVTTAVLEVREPLPQIVSISPLSGTSFGGTTLSITGINFTPDTTISLGGNTLLDLIIVDANTITAKTPPGSPGTEVDFVVNNSNGLTNFAENFRYSSPFGVQGALAISSENVGTLTITLAESAGMDISIILSSSNESVAILPDMVTIAAGGISIDIPVTAVGNGTSRITLNLGGVSLQTTVFVAPPISGAFEITASPIGSFVVPVTGITLVPVVGIDVTPALLPIVELMNGNDRTITLSLQNPAPPGGLCVNFISSDSSVASAPIEVCITEGEQSVTFTITAIDSGLAIISIVAGSELIEISVRVDQPPIISSVASATPVGVIVAPISGVTLVPVVGVEVSPTLLPILALTSGTESNFILPLTDPAPPGGLCVTLTSSSPTVATVPAEVCITEGEQSVSIAVTAISSGQALITIIAGTEVIEINVRVDQPTPISGITLAPVVGVDVQ